MKGFTVAVIAAFLLVLACLLTVSCLSSPPNIVPPSSTGEYTAVTVENFGRMVTIAEPPTSAIVAGPNCAEIFIALGLTDRVIGKCCDNHCLSPLPEYSVAYSAMPDITHGYPTLEAVVSSGCDFLYAIDWVFNENFTIEALESCGVTVYVCGATDYDGVWKEITELGKIFEVPTVAAAFIQSEKSRIAAIESMISAQPVQKVFIYDSDTGGEVFTAGGPNIETAFIETAGGENIFANLEKAWGSVSYEEIVAANPDWIIVHDYKGATYDQNVANLKENPFLSNLSAVKNQKYIRLPLESALPGSRTASSIETIAQATIDKPINQQRERIT